MKRRGGPSPEGRVCAVCGQPKAEADFYLTKQTRNLCKDCSRVINKQAALKRMGDGELVNKIAHHRGEIELVEVEIANRAKAQRDARALEIGLKVLEEKERSL